MEPMKWEKMFAHCTTNRGLIFRICKALENYHNNKSKQTSQKMGKGNEQFKKKVQMVNTHMKNTQALEH